MLINYVYYKKSKCVTFLLIVCTCFIFYLTVRISQFRTIVLFSYKYFCGVIWSNIRLFHWNHKSLSMLTNVCIACIERSAHAPQINVQILLESTNLT